MTTTVAGVVPLTPAEMELLAFERATLTTPVAKKADLILEHFNELYARYSQRLNAVLDNPAAVLYDADLVRRLTAARARRRTSYRAAYQEVSR